ncbi:unnamed protein product [Merluccius merluccius]
MGSGDSSTRRVSFGVDEEDRVRILRGVKLTEDVLQRMRGVANIAPNPPSPTTASKQPDPASKPKEPGETYQPSPRPAPRTQPNPQPPFQPASSTNTPKATANANANAKEEQKRYERQQQIMSEELTKVARKEREAARQEMSKALRGERLLAYQENEKTKQLAKQLQKKDADLKAMDAFYKEQLALLEKRNMERFRQSSEQFNQAATSCEANVRARSTEAVCSGLQAQILTCYRENRRETLQCSDLAKEYKQCISTAKKNLMVNHG